LILVNKNGASFFEFTNLSNFPNIGHAIFTRNCGHSKRPFQSLNVSSGLGDDENSVRKNRRVVATGIGSDDLVFIEQVHGNQVVVLDEKNSGLRADPSGIIGAGDAIITNIRGKFLVVQVADCQAVLLYDPIRQVVANVHTGWRGSVKNIVGRTVGFMKKFFKCNAAHLIVGIGPSLGPCCAEFVNYKAEIPDTLWRYKTRNDYFDLWKLSIDQLTCAGVRQENIEIGNMCTKCNTDLFFSYRAEGTTGRLAAVIGLTRLYA
jgi:YfiH family protein